MLAVATLPGAFAAAPRDAGAQRVATAARAAAPAEGPPAAVARAVRAARAPTIDGGDGDAVWATAPEITRFRVFDPVEDGEPALRTAARLAYDDRHLYVFVRAYDPRPDSIVSLLSRRDVRTASDQLKVMVDSYHDRRTGYEFAVNPAGVKRDYYTYDDAEEDGSWDAVWEVATRVDSLGWAAEFRIPLSQLRFPKRAEHAFGVMITRDVARTNERQSWPVLRRSRPGIASQFGTVTGLAGIDPGRRLEVTPYAVARSESAREPGGWGRARRQSVGADVKYGLSSNLTLDATVNPDFGQVEADPAVLNLTAFEQFFEERRPFFVEGTGIFSFGSDPAGVFYSRRIGRAPQLAGLAPAAATAPGATTIAGAAKVTGRLARGASLGVLAAVTPRELAGTALVEPATTYAVARAAQDFRGGESGAGVMLTAVQRRLGEGAADDRLRRSAVVGGADARHRLGGGRYQVAGSLATSVVAGSAAAIARTQRSSVHYYQRPDAALPYDTTRTRLSGTAIDVSASKLAGVWRAGASYQRRSPGLETNDLGFLARADIQSANAFVRAVSTRPRAFWRNANATASVANDFTAAGLPVGRSVELQGYAELARNATQLTATVWADNPGPVYCDRCARGGPALRLSPAYNLLVNLQRDPRRPVAPYLAAIYTVADGGRSTLWRVRPYVTVRARSGFSAELGARYQRNRDNTQWYGNVGGAGGASTHYLFAHLDQDLLSFTSRVNYTASPALSLQLYAEPFATAGAYTRVRELASPRAAAYDERFRPYALGAPAAGFNEKQFRSNAVLRWEYRPGSTLFVVWSQGRDQDDRDPGSFRAARDYRNLFGARPDNTLVVKASYWFGL